jgi:hypothetical protein
MALPFWRIGLVASSGSFIKRTTIATDLAAPVSFVTSRHCGQQTNSFC